MSAILKTYIHQTGSSFTLQNYLAVGREGHFRALACDFSPLVINQKSWSREFDSDRKVWRKNEGRKTYHFVLSPAPSENASLEAVRNFATEWVKTNLPDTKWAIYYHNDNGIVHAHIAVNAVKIDGYKLQFDDQDWAELANSAHRIAKAHGFTNETIDDVLTPKQKGEQRRNRGILEAQVKRSYKEKRLENRGKPTIKGRIREAINTAKVQAKNWKEFELLLRKEGIDPRANKQGGYTYYLLDPVTIKGRTVYDFAIKDKKLDENGGNLYTREEISKSFNFNFVDALNAPTLSANDIKKITLEYQMKRHFRVVRTPIDQDKNPMRNSFKAIDIKTYHGRLTRLTRKKSLENVDAINQAIQVIKGEGITNKQDLLVANQKDLLKRDDLIALIDKEFERKEPIDALIKQFEDLYAARILKDTEREKEILSWLSEHNLTPGHSPLVKGQREEIEAKILALDDQVKLIDRVVAEREAAYRVITEGLKLPSQAPRNTYAVGQKVSFGTYKTTFKPRKSTWQKTSFAQDALADKQKRESVNYYELALRNKTTVRKIEKLEREKERTQQPQQAQTMQHVATQQSTRRRGR